MNNKLKNLKIQLSLYNNNSETWYYIYKKKKNNNYKQSGISVNDLEKFAQY